MTPAQARALIALHDAPGFARRPCADPQAWDTGDPPPTPRGPLRAAYDAEVALRVSACRHCPVLAPCAVYAATGPAVSGVLAGRVPLSKRARKAS